MRLPSQSTRHGPLQQPRAGRFPHAGSTWQRALGGVSSALAAPSRAWPAPVPPIPTWSSTWRMDQVLLRADAPAEVRRAKPACDVRMPSSTPRPSKTVGLVARHAQPKQNRSALRRLLEQRESPHTIALASRGLAGSPTTVALRRRHPRDTLRDDRAPLDRLRRPRAHASSSTPRQAGRPSATPPATQDLTRSRSEPPRRGRDRAPPHRHHADPCGRALYDQARRPPRDGAVPTSEIKALNQAGRAEPLSASNG